MKKAELQALWQRTIEKPLWLPPNFLRYLSLTRRMDLVELKRRDVRVLGPAYGIPKCKACTDNCCIGKANRVTLRLIDIAVLMDIERTDLIDVAPAPKKEDTQAQWRFSRSQTFAVFPSLKQDENERCQALDKAKRCTLHPHWPLSCQRFPYALDLDAKEIFYSPRCPVYDVTENPRGVETMVDAALAGYNHRIRDWILLSYERQALQEMGLLAYLRL